LEDPIYSSPLLKDKVIQEWLQLIGPVEQLLDAVLHIVHPEMWTANKTATTLLLKMLKQPLPVWPTVYPGMDVIANRLSPPHYDESGTKNFFDHLISFGEGHNAKLYIEEFHSTFNYQPGTSVLFSGKVLKHSVSEWSGGERVVIAHYGKDDVQAKLEVARPSLPTQLGWWSKHS
jgi:hypothetical protein